MTDIVPDMQGLWEEEQDVLLQLHWLAMMTHNSFPSAVKIADGLRTVTNSLPFPDFTIQVLKSLLLTAVKITVCALSSVTVLQTYRDMFLAEISPKQRTWRPVSTGPMRSIPVIRLDVIIELFNWLAVSNSLLNPFIYAFFYRWFRSAFRMIVTGKIIEGNFTNSKLS
ncbi:uncharacterized protein V6R79_022065 [Siganus canaliculatus]